METYSLVIVMILTIIVIFASFGALVINFIEWLKDFTALNSITLLLNILLFSLSLYFLYVTI